MRYGNRRFHAKQAERAGAKKREVTISNLIANLRESTGREPTDAEIASYLAMSVGKVRIRLSSLARRT